MQTSQINWQTAVVVTISTALLVIAVWYVARLSNFLFFRQAVPEVTLAELYQQIQRHQAVAQQTQQPPVPDFAPDYVLVDVRTERETSVSVIPTAITYQQYESQQQDFRGQTVICYCTVGVRSEHYARRLQKAGIDVRNFKGSILEWCSAEYPLETLDGQPTQRIHTYSSDYQVPGIYEAVW